MPAFFRPFACALFGAILLFSSLGHAQQLDANSAPKTDAPAAPEDPSSQAVATAIKLMNATPSDINGALDKLNEAIKINPKNSGAYVLRASLYCQKKLWSQAEADFTIAQQLAPTNVVLKFNLVEIKFMQKQYDAARPGFLALESDPDMGDFASYKVFLCDLAGGHESLAATELAAFEKTGNPSYYFGNAAWDIAHKKFDDARSWFISATHIYPPRKNAYYAESLIYLGYLPLPPATAK